MTDASTHSGIEPPVVTASRGSVGAWPWAGIEWGAHVFGTAAIALGIIGVVRGDFTIVWHPVADALPGLPGRTALAYATALLFVLTGLGVQLSRTKAAAGSVLAALYLILSVPWIVRIFGAPDMIGTWLGVFEQMALAIGAASVVAGIRNDKPQAVIALRIGFGVAELVFGAAHLLALKETAAMTPAWLPPGPSFWAFATGAAHLAAGVALIIGIKPVLAARLLALMFTIFGLLVWLPLLVAEPAGALPWSGNAINLALIGAALALGDLLARTGRP